MKKQPSSSLQISIILVNFNGWNWTQKCLESFQNLHNWDEVQRQIEVIVVDNGSQDELVKELRTVDWITLIELPENVGFSAGNNVGMRAAQAPYVMLLNTDTEFSPNTDLHSLLDNFSKTEVGVVTPKIVLPTGELDHACHRGFPTPWNAAWYFSGVAKLFPKFRPVAGYRQSWKDLGTKHEVEACSGAAMIVRSEYLDKVGLLDEAFFMYAEDIDWCYRFAENGFKTIYDPSVTILHHKHKSGMKNASWETKERSTHAFFDTMKQFMWKHYTNRYPTFVLRLSSVMIDLLKYWKITSERKRYERTISSQ